MDKAERLERVIEVIEELKLRSLEGVVIVVEGRKDKRALRELGIRGTILLATRDSLFVFSEELSRLNREIIILTDWDRAGLRLARKLSAHLVSFGVVPDMRFHHLLSSLVRKEIKDVEGLCGYLHRLKLEVTGFTG
jgi:5S rRNA maturation endonuclease (ribonuclease M5)